jgi:hypothetical protein
MSIELIGFLDEAHNLKAGWRTLTVTETMLVQMGSPLDTMLDVQNALPSYLSTAEPTFTLGLSYHPQYTSLILKEAPTVRVHDKGKPFWLVDLVYETPQWLYGLSGPDLSITSGTGTARQPILYPWNEPVIWSGSSKQVRTTVYSTSAGVRMQHANYLPLTEGIDVEINLEQHNFTWNKEYTSFDYATDVAPYVGKINTAAVFSAIALNVLLESCSVSEHYRAIDAGVPSGGSTTGASGTHHYVTLNASFLIDRRGTTYGYFREANRRVSMHTLQLYDPGQYGPIAVNDRGDIATAPWPFPSAAKAAALGLAQGDAYPYASLSAANPDTDFFMIDPLYPLSADLTGFVSTNGLAIP